MAEEESPDVGGLLTDIRVENFRKFEESTNIQLDRVSTSLLGDNGTGKTTVLKSIELFAILYQLMIEGNNVWQPTSFANLLGIKDYKLLWHDEKTDKPIKISGTMPNQPIDFTVTFTEDSGTVRITCDNVDIETLKEIGCPTVVSISNAGVFSEPFCIDKQVAEEPASYKGIESKAVQKINVDNVKDISCLLGLSKLEGPNREKLKAEQDLNSKETIFAQTKEAFNGVLKKEGMDVEKFTKIENQMPEIDDRHKEYMNKTLRSNEYSMYKLAEAAENKAKIALKSKTEQYKETEKDLIDNCKTFSREITSLLEKFGRKKCKVEFTWDGDRKELDIKVKEKDATLPLHQCDAGLQQVIIIILAVLQVQKQAREKPVPVYLLLDEPVSLLHGNLVKKLLAYLKGNKFCVVLACHAVDTLMACNSIVTLDDPTRPRKIKMEVLSDYKKRCSDIAQTSTLMYLSKMLKTRCLVILEHETDAKVLEAWIQKLHYAIDLKGKFIVYPCKGRPTVETVMELVRSLNVQFEDDTEQTCMKIFVLVDRDYKATVAKDVEKEQLKKKMKEYTKFKVEWYCYAKNEQENYLLSALALKSWRDTDRKKKDKDREELNDIQKELNCHINDHFEYLTIMKKYRESMEYANKSMAQRTEDSKQKSNFTKQQHHDSKKEIENWMLRQCSSFTNAKEVLKKFGIKGSTDHVELIQHHFPWSEIDRDIKELVACFLGFFNIPTVWQGVHVAPSTEDEGVTLWKCPKKLSQAGLLENPEEGSKASTVIGVHLAHLLHQRDLPLDTSKDLPQQWKELLHEAIDQGNQHHRDYVARKEQADTPTLDVKEAVQAAGLQSQMEAEEQKGPLQTAQEIKESLSPLKDKPNTAAAFYIAEGNIVTCLRMTNGLTVIDTHCHENEQFGTYVYHATWKNLSAIVHVAKFPQGGTVTFLTKK